MNAKLEHFVHTVLGKEKSTFKIYIFECRFLRFQLNVVVMSISLGLNVYVAFQFHSHDQGCWGYYPNTANKRYQK